MTKIKESDKQSKRKVFIVDDHSVVREGLAQLINRESDLVVCGEAGDVSTALQAVLGCNPDVVIIDLMLQDGNGVRLIENLRYSNCNSKIIVLSMHDESVYAERCLKAGALGYIMKHEPAEKLMQALRKVLNGDVYVSDKLGAILLNKFTEKKTDETTLIFGNLSNREMEIYQLIGQGNKKHFIAEKLNLSVRTVETYIDHIKKKMNFKDSHEVIVHAVRSMIKT